MLTIIHQSVEHNLTVFNLFLLPQEAAKMEKRTSVINEGTIHHHTIKKWTYTRTFWERRTADLGQMTWFVGQTADASLRQNCSLPTWRWPWEQWLQTWLSANKDRQSQTSQTSPSPGLSHITSPATSVCVWFQFSAIPLVGEGGRVSKYFALKTPQAHSRCLVASFFVVFPSALLLPGLLHHQKKKKKDLKNRLYDLISTHWADRLITTAK